MNRYKSIATILLALIVSTMSIAVVGCTRKSIVPTQATSAIQTQVIKDITAKESFSLIQENSSNVNFVIVDVRTPSEFSEGHIKNAINIDFYAPTFREAIGKLDKAKMYLVYCRSGNRSTQTTAIMKDLGFREVYNIDDGIVGWNNNGYPTVK